MAAVLVAAAIVLDLVRTDLPEPPHVSIAWGGHSLWFYLSLMAIVGISVEWFLYQRRMIG